MFDAFNKKYVRKILARSWTEHSIEKNEDAITSMIFTPLRFMEGTEALSCFNVIFGNKLTDRQQSRVVSSFALELWPRGILTASSAIAKETRCEPDLVANINFNEGPPLVLVGEMKWDSYPSKTELEREVNREQAALTALNPDADLLIFALVKYLKEGFDQLPCHVLSWTEFHRRLNASLNFARQGSACRTWIEEVSKFLTLAEQTIFTGITQNYGALPVLGPKPIFYWAGFRGFSMNYDEILPSAGGQYFYAWRKR
jgi:hypothetical protein